MAPARVSPAMKRVVVVAALAAIIFLVWYLRRPRATIDAAPVPTFHQPAPIAHATKVTPEQRAKLADAIAKGQAARHDQVANHTSGNASTGTAATSAPKAPRLPDSVTDEPAISKTTIRSAMREVIPMLSDCYEAAIPTLPHPEIIKITVKFTLSGDPDIGTLVDASQIFDDDNQPLPAKFDDCLRSTIQSIALPPLAEGDQIAVNYPFVFAQAPPDETPPAHE